MCAFNFYLKILSHYIFININHMRSEKAMYLLFCMIFHVAQQKALFEIGITLTDH